MNRSFSCVLFLMMAALISAQAQSSSAAKQTSLQTQPAAASSASSADAGVRAFATYCSGCHGSDARGGERAPNIATARNIVALTDDDLEAIVNKGVPGSGMPSFAFLGVQEIKNIVGHLRTLQGKNSSIKISGDPLAGKTLFFGSAGCSQCHMMKGEGGYIASDLTDYAGGLTQGVVQLAITKPDTALAPTSAVVDLLLSDGKRISGMARAEDNFTITVQTTEGRWHTFQKSTLKDLKHTGQSLHPRDYGTRLTAKELDNLASYLMISAKDAPPKPAQRRAP